MENFKNITVKDCHIFDTRGGGIKVLSADGTNAKNILIDNITMKNVEMPIFIRLCERRLTYRGAEQLPTGSIDNVTISNIKAVSRKREDLIKSIQGYKFNICVTYLPICNLTKGVCQLFLQDPLLTLQLKMKIYLNKQKFRTILFVLFIHVSVFATDFNVIDFGAKADGVTIDTKAVQAAIDACTKNGGGKVIIPSGKTVVIGTIYLKDFVTLHVENGGVILGSPNYSDYATDTHKNMYKNEPHMNRCLIFAKDAKNFAIEGYGAIDGNGYKKNFTKKKGGRPMLIRFLNCNKIQVRNITLKNPAAWTSAWLYCNEITVDGIKILSRVNGNGDGLDFDGCTDVRVSNSSFDTSDDSICLQSSMIDKPCKNVVVTNCTFTSKWAGMRIGLLSRGNIESVTVSNCTFNDIQDSGLKIQLNEGGIMQNMVFSNLVMNNVPRPVFMTFAQQKACVDAPEKMYPMKSMKNFTFQNIIADNTALDKNSAFFITGMPNHYIENIILKDIQFLVSGGGTVEDAKKSNINEYSLETLKGWWPEFSLVGTLPASGIFARHVDGLIVDNFNLIITNKDHRKPVELHDVLNDNLKNVFLNREPIQKNQINRK